MRCPVCVMNICICKPGEYDREVRQSFSDFAKWKGAKRLPKDPGFPPPVVPGPSGEVG